MESVGGIPGKRSPKDARAGDASGLSGWDGIEAHVEENDQGKMKGYSEDIDGLLVFAGLFSAILTAFVVQTYPMLQPSSTDLTNQLLAANNRMLVEGFSSILTQAAFKPPPTLVLDEPLPFQPTPSARWINCLFFVSLVLSLAAALFGILVKQWVREYMQWVSPLASPRENVLVRQYRFESWEAWNVATVISTVPALLEVAMIMFLIGVIILLWTLDDVVAACVTAVTAAFLFVIAVFTILPIFSRRCPYKSPTAWALVVAWTFIAQFATYSLASSKIYAGLLRHRWSKFIETRTWRRGGSGFFRTIRSTLHALALELVLGRSDRRFRPGERVRWARLPVGWRDVDLFSCRSASLRLGAWKPKPEEALEVVGEILPLRESNESQQAVRTAQKAAEDLIVDVGESSLLLRALSWVTKSSQNVYVVTYIEQCSHVEHAFHGRGLACLLHLVNKAYLGSPNSPAPGFEEWRLFLLQFILGRNKHPVSSGLLLKAFQLAIDDYRVTVSADGLAFSEGYTMVTDYESLLMNYFPSDFRPWDKDRLEMFIFTATLWLGRRSLSHAPSEITTTILEKLTKAADVLSTGTTVQSAAKDGEEQDDSSVQVRVDHLDLLWELCGEQVTLSERYAPKYRRLLHALEKAYTRDTLCGDQLAIQKSLHKQLETAHDGGTCEFNGCRWIGHVSQSPTHYAECSLLAKGAKPASYASKLWRKAARLVVNIIRMRRRSRYTRRLRLKRVVWAIIFTHRLNRMLPESAVSSPLRTHFPWPALPLRHDTVTDLEAADSSSPNPVRKSLKEKMQERIVVPILNAGEMVMASPVRGTRSGP
ncbi:hypothetical protein PsYK624_118590 [Phanerochaete sordida]|uniref:DUF6535 domain-containing protein n=1 Tax=Phanerochaete sordida TaxID=48140 RepID=A0A9P3GGQ1_9APHY|nr:hypothetical protein PsYK624_118590 [Phanerochaete sordida]